MCLHLSSYGGILLLAAGKTLTAFMGPALVKTLVVVMPLSQLMCFTQLNSALELLNFWFVKILFINNFIK